MTPDQQAFEDRCWEHYLAERARRTMPGDVEGEPTREGLFWRREDGLYGVLAFNTAWMAYQWGMQAVRWQGVPDASAEFCRVIDHAISLRLDACEFLACWNEGDWAGCREFGFEPNLPYETAPPAPQAEQHPDDVSSLDDDHPLWLVNEQIKDLLEGLGAGEDHENVVRFLCGTGLPKHTVDRMHRAIVCAEKAPTDEQVTAGARALCNRSSEICGVNAQDNWNLESQYFKDDARCVLEAANGIKG